jgi:hypothetical protein
VMERAAKTCPAASFSVAPRGTKRNVKDEQAHFRA